MYHFLILLTVKSTTDNASKCMILLAICSYKIDTQVIRDTIYVLPHVEYLVLAIVLSKSYSGLSTHYGTFPSMAMIITLLCHIFSESSYNSAIIIDCEDCLKPRQKKAEILRITNMRFSMLNIMLQVIMSIS